MQTMQLARPYAEGLYNSIKTNVETRDQVFDELKGLMELIKKDQKFRTLLETPTISRAAKENFLDKTLRGKCHDILMNFLLLLAQKGRLFLVEDVFRQLMDILEKADNKVRAKIITAIPLDEEAQQSIVSGLEDKLKCKIILEQEVDSSILGGFILRIQDTLIDGSLRTHLENLKQHILERSKTYGI